MTEVVTGSHGNQPHSAVYRALPTYLLSIMINGKPVIMKIDSGCHDTIIGMLVWQELGQPQLEPVPYKRYSATGAEVVLIGQFIAHIEFSGKIFNLLIVVSNQTDTRNLIGRRWLPTLTLDWNDVFHCTSFHRTLKKQTERQRQLELQMAQSRTFPFYIKIKVKDCNIVMMFDTGATQSKISLSDWEKIGKPELKPTDISIRDTSNTIMPLAGRCMVDCEYNGQKAILPVLVSNGKHAYSVIGTDWFKQIRFDFNKIFNNLIFKQTTGLKTTQPTQEQTKRPLHPASLPIQTDPDQRQR